MKRFKIISLILVCPIIALIFLEILSRTFRTYNDTNPVYMVQHPKLPYTMLKNSKTKSILGNEILINSHGFRDYEYNKNKDVNTYRILVLGDSTTYGYGIKMEHSYPKVLENLLNKNFKDKKIEVLNLGVSGFNFIDYYNLYIEYGAQFQPDSIIIGVMKNDYILNSLNIIIEDGVGKRPGSFWVRNNIPPFVLRILRNSGLYLLTGNALKNIKNNNISKINSELIESQNQKTDKVISSYISKFNKISDELNIPIYYLYLPSRIEVELNKHWNKMHEKLQKNSRDKKNITYIDMLKSVRKNLSRDEEIFTPQDATHPTPFGHSIYANSIYNELLRQNIIK
tara:strand:+ start:269 stop:1288 length:1020 start_codon:yes stop_codon:yes gene_type:complete